MVKEQPSGDNGLVSRLANAHIRAFSLFYRWAIPLFDAEHIHIKGPVYIIDQIISRRFMISCDRNGACLEAQIPEMIWMEAQPFTGVAIDFSDRRLIFFAKPEEPLNKYAIALQCDSSSKLELLRNIEVLRVYCAIATPAGYSRIEGRMFSVKVVDIHSFKGKSAKLKR